MQLISTGGIITAIRRIMERCQPRSRDNTRKKNGWNRREQEVGIPYMEMGVHGTVATRCIIQSAFCSSAYHRLFHFQPSSAILKRHKYPEQALILGYLILFNLIFRLDPCVNFIFHIDINNSFFSFSYKTNILKLINSMQIQQYFTRGLKFPLKYLI